MLRLWLTSFVFKPFGSHSCPTPVLLSPLHPNTQGSDPCPPPSLPPRERERSWGGAEVLSGLKVPSCQRRPSSTEWMLLGPGRLIKAFVFILKVPSCQLPPSPQRPLRDSDPRCAVHRSLRKRVCLRMGPQMRHVCALARRVHLWVACTAAFCVFVVC